MAKELSKSESDYCRRLVLNMGEVTNAGLQPLFKPLLPEVGRNRFWRLLDRRKSRLWPRQYALRVAGYVAELRNWSEQELLAHLLEGDRTNPEIVEILRSDLLRENTNNLQPLASDLAGRLSEASQIISVQRVLPVSCQIEEILRSTVQAQADEQQFGQQLIDAKVHFGVRLRDNFLDHYDAGKTRSRFGLLSSGLDDLRTCSGIYRFSDPEHAFECIESLQMDNVRERQFDFRLIDDSLGKLPAHLADWIAPYDGVMAIDGQFTMKMHRGHMLRSFLHRGRSAQEDEEFDCQLALLHEILCHVCHDPDPKAASRVLDRYCVNIAEEADKIRAERLARRQASNPPIRRRRLPPKQIWLP